MLTFAQGMSSFGVNAAIRDLSARSRGIHFEALEKLSLGNIIGNLKIVSKVPVLVPELDNSELTETKIVTIQLTRGHHYRFDVFGAAKAELAGSPSSGSASTNFADPFLDGDTANGGITIHNFSIDVATDSDQDITNLKMLVDSLQQSVGDLADHVDGTEENLSAQIDETRQEIALVFARLDERFADLEVEVHGLTEDVAGLHGELATLQQQVQGLTSQIAVLQQNLLDHTHPYLTGAGAGHNNTSATTGAATIP